MFAIIQIGRGYEGCISDVDLIKCIAIRPAKIDAERDAQRIRNYNEGRSPNYPNIYVIELPALTSVTKTKDNKDVFIDC